MEKYKKNNIIFFIIMSIILIIFCFAITPIKFQNDTFYTIKIGESISQNGIDMVDHFSWHENLEYTYPHWLFDLIVYKIYSIGGFLGVYILTCIFTSILGISIYYCNYNLNKDNMISFLISVLTIFLMINFITARAQIVTFTLFVFTIFFIEKFIASGKKTYAFLLFLISLLIVNIHIAVWPFFFILFLPYLAQELFVYIGDKSVENSAEINNYKKEISKLKKTNPDSPKIQEYENTLIQLKKTRDENISLRKNKLNNPYKIVQTRNKNVKWLIIIMILCSIAGFITPLEPATPFTYLFNTLIGDSTINISEHQPSIIIYDVQLLIFLTLFIGILIFSKVKIRLCDLFLVGGLTLLSFLSGRQSSMLFILGSFTLTKVTIHSLVKEPNNSNILVNKLIEKPIIFLFVFIFVISIIATPIANNLSSSFVDEENYPVEATQYILDNLDIENIRLFNEYDYGSYLLFNNIPVFIDSRCDLYLPEYNENCTVFDDFIKANFGKIFFEDIFEKYDITHIILKKDSLINIIIEGLKSDKYIQLYSDDYFTIYERT